MSQTSTPIQIKADSELMTNYVHASVVSPTGGNFIALQTANAYSLLFAIGTNGAFNVIQEDSGTTTTGCTKIDLSSKFLGTQNNPFCKNFGAAQSIIDGSIGLAMVVNDSSSQNDILYLCLGNSNSNLDWLNAPNWVAFPYDCSNDADKYKGNLSIDKVFFTETIGGSQFIVVDIITDTTQSVKEISRFTIDPKKTSGTAWLPFSLSINIEAETYSSCVGQISKNAPIDGIYTLGKAGTCNQIEFRPVINYYGDGPANPTLLYLPNNVMGDSMASVRITGSTNEYVNNTDLYITGNNGLYYFSASAQNNIPDGQNCVGVLVATNNMLHDVSKLFAFKNQTHTYVWGINNSDQVFYLKCAIGSETDTTAWSMPIPIASGVNLFTPYINIVNGCNTLFAVSTESLTKITQSPETSIWSKQQLHLPPESTTALALKFSSYTTHVTVCDANNQPLPNQPITISTKTRTSFYINNIYYVIDNQPVTINSDQAGNITIIECVHKLHATILNFAAPDGTKKIVNPTDKPMKKLANLKTSKALTHAKIKDNNGKVLRTLVPSGASSKDLDAVVNANGDIQKAYKKFSPTTVKKAKVIPPSVAPPAYPNSIEADFGDLCSFVEHTADAVVNFVEDTANDVYHFVVKIGDQIYAAVLDCVEKVVAAVEYVYNLIKTAIKDLIAFLEFLFALKDFERTVKVIVKLSNLFINDITKNLQNCKTDFDNLMGTLKTEFNNWATNQPDLSYTSQTPINQQSNPTQHQTAPGHLLAHHFNANAHNATAALHSTTVPNSVAIQSSVTSLAILSNLITNEEKDLITTIDTIINKLQDANDMTAKQIVDAVLVSIADFAFDTVTNIVDALFEVLQIIFEGVNALLTQPFHIPVVSDILSDFGIATPSLLEIVSWIVAIPSTIVYKVITNKAPFKGGFANTINNANSLDFFSSQPNSETVYASESVPQNLEKLNVAEPVIVSKETQATDNIEVSASLVVTPPPKNPQNSKPYLTPLDLIKTKLADNSDALKALRIISGVTAMINAPISMLAAEINKNDGGGNLNPMSVITKGRIALGFISGATYGIASWAKPFDPDTRAGFEAGQRILLALRLSNMFAQLKNNKMSAGIDSVIGIGQLIMSIIHLVDLKNDKDDNNRKLAEKDETSQIFSYVARFSYFGAQILKGPAESVALAGILIGNLGYGGLQIAVATEQK